MTSITAITDPAVAIARVAVDDALALAFPARCACCDADLNDGDSPRLCQTCRFAIVSLAEPRCPRCGAPGARPMARGGGCAHCHTDQFAFSTVIALGIYAGRMQTAVQRMKRRLHLANEAGELFWRHRGEELRAWQPDLVAPVPMHWRRRWVHGQNAAETLADAIAGRLRLPARRRLLRRTRVTAPQTSLPSGQRKANVRGAFRAARATGCQGRRVLLVDDVLTTGATCHEAARMLRAAGAADVAVAVLARGLGEANV